MATLQELLAQRAALDAQIEETKDSARVEAVAKVKSLMAEYGLSVADLSMRTPKVAKVSKVAVKYRNPDNPAETWSGRGRTARWLAEKLKKRGVKIEDFAV